MIAIKYIIFAILSTLVNLLVQWISFYFYSDLGALYVAMFLGTLAGLIVKYMLDKKWIFYHSAQNKKDDAKKFMLYSFMGIFTTIIFWGTEMLFYYIFTYKNAKYIGAILGLSIGYIVKYYLDKKYVFITKG